MWRNANLSLNVAFVGNDLHATTSAGYRLIFSARGMPACVTLQETPHSPMGNLVYQTKVVYFSTGGPFLRRPRKADLGAARLGRRDIDRGLASRECRPGHRPVARAERSQSRKCQLSFACRPSGSAGPSTRHGTRSVTESSSK